jgi:parallel beta-helix repeat protein
MILSKLVRMLSPKRKTKSPKRFFRPRLDTLEDRRLLATFTVDDDGPTGPTQFNTIQEAVDAAFANGPARDTINVKAGTYNENVFVNTTVTIQAKGAATVDPVDDGILGVPVYGFDLEANDIVIKGFRIGDFDGDTTSGGGDGSVGINTSSLFSGYKIQNNTIENNVFGIYLNTFNGNAAKQTDVTGNTLLRNNVGFQVLPAAGNGIYSDQGARRVKISGNLFQGHQNEDIIFVGGGAPVPALQVQIKIQHNTLRQSSGIFFIGVTNSSIEGNTIRKSFANAIELAGANVNVTIKGNTLDHVGTEGYNGIYLHDNSAFGSFGPNVNNLILGNSILYDGLTGIRVRESNNNVVRGNTVIGSVGFDLSDENWGNGIGLQNGDNNTIEGNTLKFNARHGFFADADSEGNLIKNNFSFLNGASVPYGIDGFDYQDDSIGGGTAGTANTYRNNTGRHDKPNGLIQHHI